MDIYEKLRARDAEIERLEATRWKLINGENRTIADVVKDYEFMRDAVTRPACNLVEPVVDDIDYRLRELINSKPRELWRNDEQV